MKTLTKIKYIALALAFAALASGATADEAWKAAEKTFLSQYAEGKIDDSVYSKLVSIDSKKAQALKKRAEKLELYFSDVIKSEKPLVPKQCRLIVLYDMGKMHAKYKDKVMRVVKLCTLANEDTDNMRLLIADEENSEELVKLAKSINLEERKILVYNHEAKIEEAAWVMAEIQNEAGKNAEKEERVLLLTKASSARKNYAVFLPLEDSGEIKLESFVVLDIPRKEVEKNVKKDRAEAFAALSYSR